MLRILEIENRQPIHQLLLKAAQDPQYNAHSEKQTWIISDLRTKLEIQDLFLKEKGYYSEDSVLRISDLWKKILLRVDPDIRVLTPQAAQMHLRYFLREYSLHVELKDSSDPSLLKWMKDLAVLNFHPEGADRLEDWFVENPQQSQVWKDWWLRSRAAFSYFESKKMLLPQWIPAYLQSVPDLHQFWNRDLFVDLGGQLTAVEAGLIQQLSQHLDVFVLMPKLKKNSKFQFLLKPYEDLKGFAHETRQYQPDQSSKKSQVASLMSSDEIKVEPGTIRTQRFSSTLGSIRQATAQIRIWIEEGIKASEISIIAPDIESLWLVLKFHLEQEGIPFNKETVVPLQALSEVQCFLSRLRSRSRNLSLRDLELSYFQDGQNPEILFEKFQALFRYIYDEKDYHRHDMAKKLIDSDMDLQSPLNPDEFLVRMMALWNEVEVPIWLETLLREILASFDIQFRLPWKEWVLFCESCFAKKEQTESYGDTDGIFISSLMSAHFLKSRRRIFLEVSEENLKSHSRKGLPAETCSRIAQELGFWLENSDQSSLEFELEWLLQEPSEQDLLYFSVAQLTGQTQTPASVWLEYAQNQHHELTRPELTVLEAKLRSFSQKIFNERILQDLGQKQLPLLKAWEKTALSPSAVEAFLKCPFVYYARQTLSLRIFPEVDLDQDRRDLGQAVHKIFERILKKNLNDWKESDIELLLEELRPQYFPFVDEHFWKPQKAKLHRLVNRFLDFEREWRKQFPSIVNHDLEVKWEGEWAGLSFRGQIDRIDRSATGQMVLIDYKTSSYNLKGAHEWIKEGQLQMLFYINALERGWAPDLKGEVVAAIYYVIKNFKREIGLEVIGEWPGFYQNTKKKNQKLAPDEKTHLLQEFETLVSTIVDRMQKGEMAPQPKDENDCQQCDWRKICRSAHLS